MHKSRYKLNVNKRETKAKVQTRPQLLPLQLEVVITWLWVLLSCWPLLSQPPCSCTAFTFTPCLLLFVGPVGKGNVAVGSRVNQR